MEADLNCSTKTVFGIRMLDEARRQNLMPEEVFSERNKMADDGTLTKVLTYDIIRQTRRSAGLASVDAVLAFYADDPTPSSQDILQPSKRSRPKLAFGDSFPVAMRTRSKVEFDDERIPAVTVGDEASFVSIGSSIDPRSSSDVDNFCPFDMPTSA